MVLRSWKEHATRDFQGITKRLGFKGCRDARVLRASSGRPLCRYQLYHAAVECVFCIEKGASSWICLHVRSNTTPGMFDAVAGVICISVSRRR
jgi:hypothetical protein